MTKDLSAFFEPKSVAIIGASRTPGKAGYAAIANLIANGYRGKVYPVNPAGGEVLGFTAYTSALKIPEVPDLAVIIVPAAASVKALKECAEKGITAAVMVAGGFAEVSSQGALLQEDIVKIVKSSGMRVIGPNTSGLVSTPSGFLASMYPLGKLRRGPVAYVGQTGNFGTHGLHWILSAENYGVSRIVGLGNKVDIDDGDILEYLADDPDTKVVCMYIEGLRDEWKFIDAARNLSRKKPVIALRGGVTRAGRKAIALHTAVLSPSDRVDTDVLFRQAGVVRVRKYQELFDSARALAFQPLPKGNRVAVMVPSGGMGVMAADACEQAGLELAALSPETMRTLRDLSQPWITLSNPIDFWSSVLAHGVEKGYGPGVAAVLADPGVDALVCILVILKDEPMPDLSFIPEAGEKSGKTVLVAVSGDKEPFEAAKKFLEERSVPVYLPVEAACEALGTMYKCSQFIEH